MRTAVLVDVDGVLNPLVTCDPLQCACHPGWVRKQVLPEGDTYDVMLHPGHGRKLVELAADTGSELVWASYWEAHANTWIAPRVGLPEMPWVPIDAFPELSDWIGPPEPLEPAGTAEMAETAGPAGPAEPGEPAGSAERSGPAGWAGSTDVFATPGEWKALGVARWSAAAGGRPFVWFEDEYDVPDALARLARDHPLGPYLVVGVDPRTGLTDEHIAEARAWLSGPPPGR